MPDEQKKATEVKEEKQLILTPVDRMLKSHCQKKKTKQ